jgi:hypothetical protein
MEASSNPDDPNYIAAQGMGWFPGYAIDVETGMRLNIAFGEDSYLAEFNGNDMLFNPPALKASTVAEALGDSSQYYDPALFREGVPLFGGKHFVYVWRSDSIQLVSSAPYHNVKNYGYDGGQLLFNTMNFIQKQTSSGVATNLNTNFYKMVMWIGMPMGIEGTEWLPEGNDCRIRIRIAKPYAPGYGYEIVTTGNYYNNYEDQIDYFQTPNEDLMINELNPMYRFSTRGYQMPQNEGSAWVHFTEDNFYESEYSILASPDSPLNGSVEYVKMPSCNDNSVVLKAIPANSFCEFINWSENGIVVSHNAEYSFITQSDRILLANFVNHLGIEDEEMQHVTVLPNPAHDKVRIICEDMENLMLCTLEGRIAQTKNHVNANEIELDLTIVPKGIYIMRITNREGMIINKKLVIQ